MKLYLTDAEIAKLVGLTEKNWKSAATVLERSGLPAPDPMFGGRRYGPGIRAFFDRRNGVQRPVTATLEPPDGVEHW